MHSKSTFPTCRFTKSLCLVLALTFAILMGLGTQATAQMTSKDAMVANTTGDNPRLPGLANVSAVGYTYNVFGGIADEASLGRLVVPKLQPSDSSEWNDIVSLESADDSYNNNYLYPADVVTVRSSGESSANMVTTESISTYEQQISASATASGHYGYFSGSASASGSRAETGSERHYYSLCEQRYDGYSIVIEDPKSLDLDPTFENDLLTADPLQLFLDYGTHFVKGVTIGCGARMEYWANQSEFTSKSSFQATVAGSYDKVVYGGNMTASFSYSGSSSNSNSNIHQSTNIIGGDASNDISTQSGYAAWLNSFWAGTRNQAWMDFTDGGLIPLWDLLDDAHQERADSLEDAFETFYKMNTGENYDFVQVKGSSHSNDLERWTKATNENSVITGVGITVSKNSVNALAIQVRDLSSGATSFIVDEGQGQYTSSSLNTSDFEIWGTIPEGCALTGIKLENYEYGCDDGCNSNGCYMKCMSLVYQEIDYMNSVDDYLRENIESICYKGDKNAGETTVNDACDCSSDWDAEFAPAGGSNQVITSIALSSNKGGVPKLNLYLNTLQMPQDPGNIQ